VRTVGVVTTTRADYGPYLPVLRQIQADPDLDLYLIVSGMHLSPEFGMTVRAIEQDGFEILDRVDMLLASDTPEGISKSMGLGTIGFAQSYARFQPDILLVLGDRFEMHSAVVAALPFKIPVAHIGGGEATEGAIDESIRHSITKMSHLHFVSTDAYAERVIQMGEEPWRVVVSGAPSLDSLNSFTPETWTELQNKWNFDLAGPVLLVTFHPVTLSYESTGDYMEQLLDALDGSGFDLIFTYPNADTHGRQIISMIERFTSNHPRSWAASSLGTESYFSLMTHATAMVGNSSSGIIESSSFKLPVVNIGDRQQGRIQSKNILNVGYRREEIREGIKTASSPGFRDSLSGVENPYGDGHAAERIVKGLKSVAIDDALLMKRFYSDSPASHKERLQASRSSV
jgi:UDP-hydrolysing UDP-N-acetyl-D-glucosamine 2-epimerase